MTGTRFQRPEGFDALAFIERSVAEAPRRHRFAVLFNTDVATLRDTVGPLFGAFEPHGCGVLLHGSTDDLDWLARQLASFPFAYSIVSPDGLREALRRRASELAAIASNEEVVDAPMNNPPA